MVVVLSLSAAHKHYSLADIEWKVMPPVPAGQFYVVEAMDEEHGYRAPVAAGTWVFVSKEVDQTLQQQAGPSRRLGCEQIEETLLPSNGTASHNLYLRGGERKKPRGVV
jgi:hemolysin-activating ACP:hemolysin acyltransferase